MVKTYTIPNCPMCEELKKYIEDSEKNKIFIFYVTIAGIIFVREFSLEEDEQIVDSTSLANYPINTEFNDSNVLFYNYSWLKPLELKRCGKDPFGNLRWHMASYNGISPQIVGTPIHTVDTNYYWADNYLLQIKNSDESARNYYGLRIRPYVQLDMNHDEGEYNDRIPNEEKTNAYVVLNVSDQSTPPVDSTKPGIFLYNYPFAENLHFGGTNSLNSVFSIVKENNDYHLQLYGDKDYNSVPGTKYILGTIHLRNPGQDQEDLFLSPNYISLSGGGLEHFYANKKRFKYTSSGNSARLFYTYEGGVSLNYNTNQGSQGLKIAIDGSQYYFDNNLNRVRIEDYTPTSSNPLRFYYDENTELIIGCEKTGNILKIIEAFYLYSDNSIDTYTLRSTTDGFITTPPNSWYIDGSLISLNNKVSITSDLTTISNDTTIAGATNITNTLAVSKSVTILDTCSANEFEVTSDRRHKDIHGLFNFSGLNVIDNLPIYKYSFKTTPDKETIGVTAQDLLEVLPQLVDTSDESHYKINESKLVYVCMQAIKELNIQIKILKQEISDLRGN